MFITLVLRYATMITFSTMTTRNAETGVYYYGARYYSPDVSVWLSVDPLAHKFPWQSPYCFTNNNPINLIDPDGRAASPIFSKEGDLLGTDSEGWSGKAIVMEEKDFKQGMDHNDAQSKGTELDKHGEGIKISDKSWNKVEKNGGTKMEPYVKNKSNETVYYKPEGEKDGVDKNPGYDATGAYPIGPNSDLYAPADGVNTSAVDGEVFKMPDQFPRVVISPSGVPDIQGILESVVPGIGTIDAPDAGWYKLRDSIKKK